MFLESFKITGSAVAQIFLLGAIGYFLMKRNVLGREGLGALSRLAIDVTLPLLIFSQLLQDFGFSRYPDWWIFPLTSLLITAAGLAIGWLFSGFVRDRERRSQFLSLVTFQNSGYLPLALIGALLPKDKAGTMFIYLFLFLIGFNIVMFSAGVYMLTSSKVKKIELSSLLSPPVIAALLGLAAVFLGLDKILPQALLKPLRMAGDCTLVLSMFVVGGGLAQMKLKDARKKEMLLLVLAKLILLPAIGLWLIVKLHLPELIGLLMLIQLAMPSANSLSIIVAHYKKDDLLISQGIFFTHLLSVISIPVFLSIYFALFMVK